MKIILFIICFCFLSVINAAKNSNETDKVKWDKIKLKIKVRGKNLLVKREGLFVSSYFKKNTFKFYNAYKHGNFFVFTSEDKSSRTKYLMTVNGKFYEEVIETFPNNLGDARVFYIEKGTTFCGLINDFK